MISPLTIRDSRKGCSATSQTPLALPTCKTVRCTAMGAKAAVVLLLSSQFATLTQAAGGFIAGPKLRYLHSEGFFVGWREVGGRRARDAPLPPGRARSRDGGGVMMTADLHLDDPPQLQGRRSEKEAVHRVVFMRHGECHWNRDNRFLGWADIGLTEHGEKEARKAAHTLAEFDVHVDEVFCSYLKRSIKSAWLLADEMNQSWMPIQTDWRLNEQMYGALQGLNKHATAERYGTDLTQQWRRSYDIAPPAVPGGRGYFPVGDVKYAALTEDDIPASWCGSPNTESLKDAQARSWAFWRERMVPRLNEGKAVLICGHGNIIRSMLKRLDSIPNDVLKQVTIPRAIPLVYELDEDFMPVSTPDCHGPLGGRFLGSALELAEAFESESVHAQLGGCPSR